MKIKKLLVANRGEIASRIFRTCRQLGIETVAVFSDADAEMPFVRDADEAMRIGPAASRESYLRIDRILEAAAQTGSNAVHPGRHNPARQSAHPGREGACRHRSNASVAWHCFLRSCRRCSRGQQSSA